MPEVPDDARLPQDHQTAAIKPQEHVDGWNLLRPPIDLEFWEETDLLAAFSRIKQRGAQVDLTGANLKAIGEITKQFQEVIAVDSTAFKTWLAEGGDLVGRTKRILELANDYTADLGEAAGSAS